MVYGVDLKDVLTHEDLAVGSYRFAVSRLIPQMTQVALQVHKKEFIREKPDFAKKKFLYRLSRTSYEKEWGKDYQKPGIGTRILSTLLRFMPRIGPFKGLGFDNPTPQTEDLYIKSINTTVDQYRAFLEQVRTNTLVLPNCDLDSGQPTNAAEYSLTDDAYAKLLAQLSERKFDRTSPRAARQHPAVLFRPLAADRDQERPGGLAKRLDRTGSVEAGHSSANRRQRSWTMMGREEMRLSLARGLPLMLVMSAALLCAAEEPALTSDGGCRQIAGQLPHTADTFGQGLVSAHPKRDSAEQPQMGVAHRGGHGPVDRDRR